MSPRHELAHQAEKAPLEGTEPILKTGPNKDSLALIVEDNVKHRGVIESVIGNLEAKRCGKWEVKAYPGRSFTLPDVRKWLRERLEEDAPQPRYRRTCLVLDLSWNEGADNQDRFLMTLLCPESMHLRLKSEVLPESLRLLEDPLSRRLDDFYIAVVSSFGLESMKSLCRFFGADGVIQKHPQLDLFFLNDGLEIELWNKLKHECPHLPKNAEGSSYLGCPQGISCAVYREYLERLLFIRKSKHKALLNERIERLIQGLNLKRLTEYSATAQTSFRISFDKLGPELLQLREEIGCLLHLQDERGTKFDLDELALEQDFTQFFEWVVKFPNRSGKVFLRNEAGRRNIGSMLLGSAKVQEIIRRIRRYADAPTSVLITGESGTGKELVAKAIHQTSSRTGRPFIPWSCADIPESLAESQLYGYLKGIFTGAIEARDGIFELAQGGTLFLDEIGELPLALQTKLLRVIEEQKVRKLGAKEETSLDVRIIAATNRDLRKAVHDGEFRLDLYHRLAVLSIHTPPLREHLEDIRLLAEHFIQGLAAKHGLPPIPITENAIKALQQYKWPGNVRELRNVLERILLDREPSEIDAGDVHWALEHSDGRDSLVIVPPRWETHSTIMSQADRSVLSDQYIRLSEEHSRFKSECITRLVQSAVEDKTLTKNEVARLLRCRVDTLEREMKDLGIEQPSHWRKSRSQAGGE